jgi:alpha-L-fucosidase 2
MISPIASCVCLAASLASAGNKETRLDLGQQRWSIDPAGIVSCHDVLYTTPSLEPWEAMPTGGGDLSAMVRWDGSLRMHLSKSDCWGFQTPPNAPLGLRLFNNTSPGRVRVDFGSRGRQAASQRFRQRLDLYCGRIVVELGDERAGTRLEVWGHPVRKILVVEVTDPQMSLDAAQIELSQWRSTMQVGTAGETLYAREIHERPARPHLVNTGMQDFFTPDRDPLCGRGTAVSVACPAVAKAAVTAKGLTATLALPEKRPSQYHVIIAAAVTPSGDPLAAAKRELDEAAKLPLATLKAEQQAWWREYWSRSFVHVTSPDRSADRLCGAYHVHLYTLGCVNRGPYPAKWDGGPGLMREDQRNWGLAEWVQEIRFTYLPLYAANHLDIARGLTRHYSAMVPYLTEQTKKMWGLPGLWIPETVLPWGHAEDFLLKDDGHTPVVEYLVRRDPSKVPYGRFERYNPYIGFLFTAGLEICEHYLTYYRYTGDEDFLRRDAYPVIRGVCEFLAGLLRKENDGRYHLDPANALETWWMVRDPTDTLSGIQAVFPEFIRLAEKYGQDAELKGRCATILAALPEPTRGLWAADGKITRDKDVYAPAAATGTSHPRTNSENPALYRVFPFGLSGIGSADSPAACRTFERRICPLEHGWAMDALWAARLGLREQACSLAAQHAERYQRYRYGGWTSNDSRVFPGGLSAAPFMDAGGLSAFTINEILLQSHKGILRVAPATAKTWSGVFRLRGEGGFLITSEFGGGEVRRVEVQSLWGRTCVIANPWSGPWTVRDHGQTLAQGNEPTIRFATKQDGSYLIGPARARLVEVVIPPQADKLERFAASELQRYLVRLFGASVNMVPAPTASADCVFLLGAVGRHSARALGQEEFPQLTEQGFLLRTTRTANKPAMTIAGGSPAATLWAVYELVERWGVRYLLGGDVFPAKQQDFVLPQIDKVFEPGLRLRWWRTMGDFAMGTEGWGMADYRPVIDQLAKLKFNRIRVGSSPSQPFLHLDIQGVQQQFATLWYGYRYPITPDMPGRMLFGNAKEFWNPDLPMPADGYEKLAAAGRRHCHELIAYAHDRGMEASFVGSILDFPKEFRSIVPDARVINQLGELTVGPGPTARPDSEQLLALSGAVIRTMIDTYPEADSYGFPVGTEWRSWIDLYEWAWREMDKTCRINEATSLEEVLRKANQRTHYPDGAERAVREVKGDITGLYFLNRLWANPEFVAKSKKPNARLVVYEPAEELFPILSRVLPRGSELVIVVDYTATGVLRRRSVLGQVPAKQVPTTLVLVLQEDNIGVVPQLTTGSLHELLGEMRKNGLAGFCTRQWMISDLDPCVAYLSKAAWDAKITPAVVYADQIRSVCGDAAVAPMLETFRELEAVTIDLEDHDLGLSFPVPGMIMKHWSAGPLEPQHARFRNGYRRAIAAAKRVSELRRPEGQAYVRYWIGRLGFGVGYIDTIEAIKKAATAEKEAADAKQKNDPRLAKAKLREAAALTRAAEKTAFQAIESLAAVAKNRADCGAIATMAEYVHRPLQRKADALQTEHDKAP